MDAFGAIGNLKSMSGHSVIDGRNMWGVHLIMRFSIRSGKLRINIVQAISPMERQTLQLWVMSLDNLTYL